MRYINFSAVLLACLLSAACSSNHKTATRGLEPNQSETKAPESRIAGNFASDSAFAKLKLGMTQGQVHEILGQPTDTQTYQTGKAWIPFYFGPDVMRTDEFYKGIGVLTYTGAGIGGVHWTLFRAIYDAAEDGVASH